MAKTKEKVLFAAGTAKPYVDRALRDEAFRENLRTAFEAGREIYNDLAPPRGLSGVAARVARDEEIQQNLRRAISELRLAADRLQGQKKHSHTARNALLLLVGIAIGLFFNPYTGPEARRRVKNRFASDGRDEFAYPDARQTHNPEPPAL
jgi:hypothetical protein